MKSGLRRAAKMLASQVRQQVRKEKRFEKIRRIGLLHEHGQVLMRAIQPNYAPPVDPQHFTKVVEALMLTKSAKVKEPRV